MDVSANAFVLFLLPGGRSCLVVEAAWTDEIYEMYNRRRTYRKHSGAGRLAISQWGVLVAHVAVDAVFRVVLGVR